MFDTLAPPSEYVRPYDGPLNILSLPMQRLGIVCRMLGIEADGTREVRGCAVVRPYGCVVFLPIVEREVTAEDRAKVLDHELAHCNGWTHEK